MTLMQVSRQGIGELINGVIPAIAPNERIIATTSKTIQFGSTASEEQVITGIDEMTNTPFERRLWKCIACERSRLPWHMTPLGHCVRCAAIRLLLKVVVIGTVLYIFWKLILTIAVLGGCVIAAVKGVQNRATN